MAQAFSLTKRSIIFPRRILTREKAGVSVDNRETTFYISVICILMLIVSIVAYIFMTNSIVANVYQLEQHEKYLAELQEENRILEIQAAQIRSTANLEKLVEDLGMVELGEVEHLSTGDVSVALEP